MKKRMLVLWLVPLLGACAAPAPQADPAAQGQEPQPGQQVQQLQPVVIHDYALDSITGSHLKRRRGDSAMNGQTVSREDWERSRPADRVVPCPSGCM